MAKTRRKRTTKRSVEKKFSVSPRTDEQRLKDLKQIAQYRKSGMPWVLVAKKLNEQYDFSISWQAYRRQYVDQLSKLKEDADEVMEDYFQTYVDNILYAMGESAEAWERSKVSKKKTQTRVEQRTNQMNPDGDPNQNVVVTTEEQETVGEVRFMETFLKSNEQLAKALDLDKRKPDGSPTVNFNLDGIPLEQRVQLAKILKTAHGELGKTT